MIDVDVDATETLVMLERLDDALSMANIAMTLKGPVEEFMQERARVRFEQEGDDASGKWMEITSATRGIRRSKGFSEEPINVRTGEMRSWITNVEGQLAYYGDDLALEWPGIMPTGELGDKVEHAQFGDPASRTPARPIIAADEVDLLGIVGMLHTEIYREMGVPI